MRESTQFGAVCPLHRELPGCRSIAPCRLASGLDGMILVEPCESRLAGSKAPV